MMFLLFDNGILSICNNIYKLLKQKVILILQLERLPPSSSS